MNYTNKKHYKAHGREPKQFKGLKAEEYVELGGRYAITISPEDSRDSEKDTFKDYSDIKEHIREVNDNNIQNIFKRLKFCEVEVYPELSPTGRLHYHGVLTVIDTVGFLWHDVQIIREQSICEVDTIKDMNIWLEYVQKQQHLMNFYFDMDVKPIIIKNRKMESLK